jgi:hypothetical protein
MIAGGGCGFCRRLSRQFADDALQVEGTGRDQFVDFSLVEYGVWNLVGLRAIGLFMRIQIDASALTQTKWYEYAVRFIFGGVITPVAGLIAKKYGPVVGGLFLTFPAIFPASATLIEKHEEERKKRED